VVGQAVGQVSWVRYRALTLGSKRGNRGQPRPREVEPAFERLLYPKPVQCPIGAPFGPKRHVCILLRRHPSGKQVG